LLDVGHLERLYLREKMSIGTLAERLGCGRATVYRHLQQADIPLRTKQQAQWLVYERCEREYPGGDPAPMQAYWRARPRAAERRRKKAWQQSAAFRSFNALVTVVCAHCGQAFRRRRGDIRSAVNRGRRLCCSPSCRARLVPRRRSR
jgi:transposase-like protein